MADPANKPVIQATISSRERHAIARISFSSLLFLEVWEDSILGLKGEIRKQERAWDVLGTRSVRAFCTSTKQNRYPEGSWVIGDAEKRLLAFDPPISLPG